jgi:hypothetical protein
MLTDYFHSLKKASLADSLVSNEDSSMSFYMANSSSEGQNCEAACTLQ